MSRPSGVPGPRFKGKCQDLGNNVYDTGLPNSNQDLFAITTREIAEYVAKMYDHAGEFRMGLINLELEDIQQPPAPDANAGFADTEMYKIRLKHYADKARHRETNLQRVFPLILGQCSRTIRD